MSYDSIEVENNDGVSTIFLNRPDVRNAFNQSLTDDLQLALETAAKEAEVRVVIITGKGKGFSAGADLVDRKSRWSGAEESLLKGFLPSIETIMHMPKPVISAVNGAAAGVGAAFALASDLSIMSENAYLLLAFSNIGLVPDGGCHWLLARTVGHKTAYQIAVEGERVAASRCLELGLCNRVVPDDELISEAHRWAKRLAERAPLAMAYTKSIMRNAMETDFKSSFGLEGIRQDQCIVTEDHREGVAAFREKRRPNFKGL